jgi:hypothetical protein
MSAADLTTPQLIGECRIAQNAGMEVSDAVAQCIAGYWHGGMGSAFYSFASSGHYDRSALLRELSDVIASSYREVDEDDRMVLDMLGTYLVNRDSEAL